MSQHQPNEPTALRSVLCVTGADRVKFLQGLVSNDVGKLENNAVYTALLTPQGKFIVDFFVIPHGDALLLDVRAEDAPGLLKRLTMYKMRSKVDITATDLQVTRGLGPTPEGAFADPRSKDLGWRAYDGQAEQAVDWDRIRVEHCIPETGIELGADSYVLEVGFERLNGVDFRKGCYVGQEVTARMKHKAELRKGLETVAIKGTAPVGTKILTSDGKDAGTVFTQSNGKAIAYLRFDRAKGELHAEDAIITRL